MGKITTVTQRGIIWVIKGYQYLISPMLGQRCRFFPSCSEYAEQAIKEHGMVRGIYLAVRRILRCHPFHPGGLDPVPQKQMKE